MLHELSEVLKIKAVISDHDRGLEKVLLNPTDGEFC